MARFGFGAAVLAGSMAMAPALQAAPVVFNIDFDGALYDGGGTLTIDDSLIAPNATVVFDSILIDIDFGGIHFDSAYLPSIEGFTFDSLGEQIVSTTFNGSLTEFLDDPSFAVILALLNGDVPGSFETYSLPGGDDRGTYTITRAVSAVPLPAGWLLLLGALGGIALVARRRKAE